jgi:hypothetical protein
MRLFALLAAMLMACGSAVAQANTTANQPDAAQANHEQGLAHDRHEGLSISADPYTDNERAKKKFGKANPIPAGILPVEVFLRNELDQPIRIDLSTIQLEVHPPGGTRQDVDSLSAVDVAQALVHPTGSGTPGVRRFPQIGIPSSTDKKVDSMAELLRPLTLDSDVVPPSGMIHGFLFFNLSHQMSLAENASIYVPDAMIVPSNKALIFFEVSLGNTSDR